MLAWFTERGYRDVQKMQEDCGSRRSVHLSMIWRTVLCVAVLSAASTAALASPPETPSAGTPPSRPAWCQAGWACIPTRELAAATEHLIDLEERIALLRAKRHHALGVHVTCGIGIAGVVDKDYRLRLPPAGYCGVGYGW